MEVKFFLSELEVNGDTVFNLAAVIEESGMRYKTSKTCHGFPSPDDYESVERGVYKLYENSKRLKEAKDTHGDGLR